MSGRISAPEVQMVPDLVRAGAPVAYLDSFRNVPAKAARYTNFVRIRQSPSK
jgi:hypothetical protein